MANIKSKEKRHSQSIKRRIKNREVKGHIRNRTKSFESALVEGDFDIAKEAFRMMTKVMDTAARKGVIHPKTAARKKSRSAKKLSLLSAS